MLPQVREDGLVVQELADETVVYDLDRHQAHCLNPTAALVWRHCDGRTTVAEMAARLDEALNIRDGVPLVRLALVQLDRAHLLCERSRGVGEAARVSRRAVARQLGLTAGLAVLLPLVTSIVAPTPAMAATCTPNAPKCKGPTQPCTGNQQCCTCVCVGGRCT